jgi:ABC-2 type transport system ATP-binding protein
VRLHEIEVIADDLVVMGQGRLVAQGMKDKLVTRSRDHRSSHGIGRARSRT